MNKLHDNSDTKTIINEMGYTSSKQPRKKSKPDSTDKEMKSVTTKNKKTCKTRVAKNESGYYLGVLAIFLGYMIGSATAMNMNKTESNPEFLRKHQEEKTYLS